MLLCNRLNEKFICLFFCSIGLFMMNFYGLVDFILRYRNVCLFL